MSDWALISFKHLVHLNWNLALLVVAAWAILGRRAGPRTQATVWTVLLVRCFLQPWLYQPTSSAPLLDHSRQGYLSLGVGFGWDLQTLRLVLGVGDTPVTVADLFVEWLGAGPAVLFGYLLMLCILMDLARRAFLLWCARGSGEGIVWTGREVTPHITGWLKPSIVLSTRLARRLEEDELLAVLEHERAHLARWDHRTFALFYLLRSLQFVLPPLRVVLNSLERAIEQLCDARAARIVGSPALGRALVKLAGVGGRGPLVGAAFCGSDVRLRVRALRSSFLRESLLKALLSLLLVGAVLL